MKSYLRLCVRLTTLLFIVFSSGCYSNSIADEKLFSEEIASVKGYFLGDEHAYIAHLAVYNTYSSSSVTVYNPWQNLYGCKEHRLSQTSVIVSRIDSDWSHVLTSCGELDLEGMTIFAGDVSAIQYSIPVANNVEQVVVVPTDAGIDTYLYWNGEKFELYAPEETP
ncbi:hypothetical protein [Agarivorans gilvus]|uniref:Lipoprotein n=1 Tax=Agarivorans gilvus TaxID=680279 RepID=A0ABQ1I848_9ALTE|nr:hypothetical protein [Agarivorans gilvus]GGB21805.1 hypothetical protein GCM10007414_38990 [Agarivorans gilvus]